jgi:polyisoprenoid-binding protein YceI
VQVTNVARTLPEATVRYVIDNRGSTFTLRAVSEGLLAAFGHSPKIAVRDFAGAAEVDMANGRLQGASVQIHIRADSLEVSDDVNEKDRREIQHKMYEEVLEIDRFPEIAYEVSKVSASASADGRYWAALSGELTLHGVTHPLPISARVIVTGDMLRATGEFSVRMSDYGIERPSVAAGAVKIKDEVKGSFDIVARKQA